MDTSSQLKGTASLQAYYDALKINNPWDCRGIVLS